MTVRHSLSAYAPCEMHSIKGGMTHCQDEMKKAVDAGYWNMFRFNPDLKKAGKNPFTLDSKPASASYRDFIMNEARYSRLTREFPREQKRSLKRLRRLLQTDMLTFSSSRKCLNPTTSN